MKSGSWSMKAKICILLRICVHYQYLMGKIDIISAETARVYWSLTIPVLKCRNQVNLVFSNLSWLLAITRAVYTLEVMVLQGAARQSAEANYIDLKLPLGTRS